MPVKQKEIRDREKVEETTHWGKELVQEEKNTSAGDSEPSERKNHPSEKASYRSRQDPYYDAILTQVDRFIF